jgi:hypothetical protein
MWRRHESSASESVIMAYQRKSEIKARKVSRRKPAKISIIKQSAKKMKENNEMKKKAWRNGGVK